MSMTHGVLPIEHPEWCAAPFCENPHPTDFTHSSIPIAMNAAPLDERENGPQVGTKVEHPRRAD